MKQQSKKCAYCEEEFIPARRNRKFCSDTCKQYNYLTKKTGKRYGVDKAQLIDKVNIETEPLVITEQIAAPPSEQSLAQSNPSGITITYELTGKDVQKHLPKGIILGKWYSTFTG
jgi:hypothetical protein